MHSDQNIDGKVREVVAEIYKAQISICIEALKKLRSADMTDKNVIVRAIMCDIPAWGIDSKSAEDCAVDFWVDRAEYVDNDSFNLYVTQAEENVLWNIEKKVRNRGVWMFPNNGSPCEEMGWTSLRLSL